MSRFLYKYMPLRANFFIEPMIRATPVRILNDPFEGNFNLGQVREADRHHTDYYRSKGHDIWDADEHTIKDLAGIIQSDLADLGILSFTEDHKNPLMWAHYADEHRGVVVEFDFTQPFFMDSIKVVDDRKCRFNKDYSGEIYEFPEKVDYRFDFPDFSRPEFAAPDSMTEYHWKKFNRAVLFTKANDWIYEKEQRAVVQLKDADVIVCDDNEHVRKLCLSHPGITITEEKEVFGAKRIRITYPREYEMHENMADQSVKSEIHSLTSNLGNSPIHLFRINPEAISAIYFGCKAEYRTALKNTQDNPLLSNLRHVFQMRVDPSHYRLNAVPLEQQPI